MYNARRVWKIQISKKKKYIVVGEFKCGALGEKILFFFTWNLD